MTDTEPKRTSRPKHPKLEQKLVRLPKRGVLAGVAAGFADYLEVQVSTVRLVFLVTAFATSGVAAFAYVALVVLLPARDPANTSGPRPAQLELSKLRLRVGIGLAGLGLAVALGRLIVDGWSQAGLVWPIILAATGVAIAVKNRA